MWVAPDNMIAHYGKNNSIMCVCVITLYEHKWKYVIAATPRAWDVGDMMKSVCCKCAMWWMKERLC